MNDCLSTGDDKFPSVRLCCCASFYIKYTSVIDRIGRERAVAQWLRCCATSRKAADSIPDGVTGIFH